MWRGIILGIGYASVPRGGAPTLPNFEGFLLFMPSLINAERPHSANFPCERGAVFLGVSHASHPNGAEPQRSQIFGFPLFMLISFDVEPPNSAW